MVAVDPTPAPTLFGRIARARQRRRRRLGLLLLIIVAASVLVVRVASRSLERPVFADEFDGTGVDFSRWESGYPWGCTNKSNEELECYTKDSLGVHEGMLQISADHRNDASLPFRSGMITSYKSFAQRYGYFEIRAKLPAGKGFWPAFWLLPKEGDSPPELDVMEHVGSEPGIVHMTQHYLTPEGKERSSGLEWRGPDFTAGFHTFALSWSPDRLVWLVDGVPRFTSTTHIPNKKMYLLINLAVGGEWPGSPDEYTRFPNVMLVDYVRVWRTPEP